MAIARRLSIEVVSAIFSEALQDVDVAREAWVSSSSHDAYDLWLRVDVLDMHTERALYALVDPLYAQFPSTEFSLHILNPGTFIDLAPEAIVPTQAHPIRLRSSA